MQCNAQIRVACSGPGTGRHLQIDPHLVEAVSGKCASSRRSQRSRTGNFFFGRGGERSGVVHNPVRHLSSNKRFHSPLAGATEQCVEPAAWREIYVRQAARTCRHRQATATGGVYKGVVQRPGIGNVIGEHEEGVEREGRGSRCSTSEEQRRRRGS
ncbi:hypothetical protein K470DRAFT_21526 [Piedraia hortae CBS 480.64]|uniref:Uncharacterized protein n=1 Tax=Piedraia hortae CBS 480.64 TaxID=1314780 RepID=A0A6A7C463_9PEZI|nr:hypothetical protein K470DRAFT_21526 [Piedraia hortae CBS 480.64]